MKIKRVIKWVNRVNSDKPVCIQETVSGTFIYTIDLSNWECIQSNEFSSVAEAEVYILNNKRNEQ